MVYDSESGENLVEDLPAIFPRDDESGNYKLFQVVGHEVDDTTTDINSVDRATTVQHADTVAQLEELGELVNVDPRNGEKREKYRSRVLGNYQLTTSEGSIKDILHSVAVILNTEVDEIGYEEFSEDLTLAVKVPKSKLKDSALSDQELAKIIDDLAAAGARVESQVKGTFEYVSESTYNDIQSGNDSWSNYPGYDGTSKEAIQSFTASSLPAGWSIGGDASYDSTNERVELNPGTSNTSGNAVYDSGIGGITRWAIDTGFYIDGDADEYIINFYSDAPGTNAQVSNGYSVSYDHYHGKVELQDETNSVLLAETSVTIPDTADSNTGRVEYFNGTVRVFLNGKEVIDYTISNPDYSYDGLSFGGWDGSVSGLHALEDIHFRGGGEENKSGAGTYAGTLQ